LKRMLKDDRTARLLLPVLLGMLILLRLSPAIAADPEDKVSRIQKAYQAMTDIRGSFVQKSTIKDLNRTDTYKGEFFIKPPMKMKWAYRGNAAQDIIVNGDAVLILRKADKQAFRSRFDKETYGQTPIALLGGFGKIHEEFSVSQKGDSLVLKPRKAMGNISTINIRVAEEGFPIKSFTIHDSRSNSIEFELKEIKINSGLKDSLFDLSVPAGVSVLDQSL